MLEGVSRTAEEMGWREGRGGAGRGQDEPPPGAFEGGMPWQRMWLPGKLQRQPASLLPTDKLLIFRGTPNGRYTHSPL